MVKYSYTDKPLNIFETIEKPSSRIERYHSEFLASILANVRAKPLLDRFVQLAVGGDDRLFNDMRKETPDVFSEFTVKDGSIDVVLHYVEAKVVIAVEVKTTDKSTTEGQLFKYYEGLQSKKDTTESKIFTVYLTPFNRDNIGEDSRNRIHAIKEFECFTDPHHPGVHLNWQQVAELYKYVEGDQSLLSQHEQYINERLCNKDAFISYDRNRALANFVGDDAFLCFDRDIQEKGIERNTANDKRWTIPLGQNKERYADIVSALEILIDADGVNEKSRRTSTATKKLLNEYKEKGPHQEFFIQLFEMLSEKEHVFFNGVADVGVKAVSLEMQKPFSLFSFSCDELIFIENR